MLVQECEADVVAFGSDFGCESTSSRYECVGEGGLIFSAYKGRAILPLASVDVDAPCDFQGVLSSLVWGIRRVCMDCVVRSRVYCVM